MQIRCPHCHSPIEVVDADVLTDISCPGAEPIDSRPVTRANVCGAAPTSAGGGSFDRNNRLVAVVGRRGRIVFGDESNRPTAAGGGESGRGRGRAGASEPEGGGSRDNKSTSQPERGRSPGRSLGRKGPCRKAASPVRRLLYASQIASALREWETNNVAGLGNIWMPAVRTSADGNTTTSTRCSQRTNERSKGTPVMCGA